MNQESSISHAHCTLYTVYCTLYCTLTVHCKFGFETYYNAQARKLLQHLLINLHLLSKQ